MARDDVVEFMPRQVFNRHWVWLFLWLGMGVFLGRHAGGMASWLGIAPGLVGVVLLCVPERLPRRAHWGTALLCLALGLILYGLRAPGPTPDPLGRHALDWPRARLEFEGVVKRAPLFIAGEEYANLVLQVDTVRDGDRVLPLRGRTLVRWTRPAGPVYAGTRVRVTGRLSPHLGVVNHGVSGFEDYYRARGMYSHVRVSGNAVQVASVNRWSPFYWTSRLRQWQHEQLSRVIPADIYPFVLGVWLGEQAHINRDVYRNFQYAGTAHVLSVSGVHVGIITISLGFLLDLLRMSRRLRNTLLMGGVLVFTLMTGAQTATVRSALMICLYLSAELFDREADPLSVLGLSGFAFLAWAPVLLFDTSFLLSFGSLGSIMLFYPGLSRVLAALPVVFRGPLATTAAAQAVTIPIAAWHFSIVPLFGVIANLAVIPLLTAVLWLCFLCGIAGAMFSPLAALLGHALVPVVKIIEGVNAAVLYLPGAYASVTRPGILAVAFYAASLCVLFVLTYDARYRKRNGVIAAGLFLMSLVFWNLSWKGPVIDFLDVGTGDSIFLRTPGGTTLLVDGGDTSTYTDAGERVVAPFLHAHGIRRLDYVVVTHPDRDHIGGLFFVLDHFTVDNVLLGPEGQGTDVLEAAFLAKCADHGVPVQRLERGGSVPADGAEIRVLHPTSAWVATHKGNNNSLVLHVSWPGISLLLPGDVEEEAEAELLPWLDAGAAVLKAPHHGSPTSSSVPFLETVKPAVAVASMQAAGSRQTLMTPPMVQRYADHGITLFRTDWHGGVRIEPSRNGYHVVTARGARGYSLEPALYAKKKVAFK